MIVLGKDKIDERFNIRADGTIVDLNGKIQYTNGEKNIYLKVDDAPPECFYRGRKWK